MMPATDNKLAGRPWTEPELLSSNHIKLTEENNVIHSDSEILIKKDIVINNKNNEKNEESSKKELSLIKFSPVK